MPPLQHLSSGVGGWVTQNKPCCQNHQKEVIRLVQTDRCHTSASQCKQNTPQRIKSLPRHKSTSADFHQHLSLRSFLNSTTSFASRLWARSTTIARRCPCVLFCETARIPRDTPAKSAAEGWGPHPLPKHFQPTLPWTPARCTHSPVGLPQPPARTPRPKPLRTPRSPSTRAPRPSPARPARGRARGPHEANTT